MVSCPPCFDLVLNYYVQTQDRNYGHRDKIQGEFEQESDDKDCANAVHYYLKAQEGHILQSVSLLGPKYLVASSMLIGPDVVILIQPL